MKNEMLVRLPAKQTKDEKERQDIIQALEDLKAFTLLQLKKLEAQGENPCE